MFGQQLSQIGSLSRSRPLGHGQAVLLHKDIGVMLSILSCMTLLCHHDVIVTFHLIHCTRGTSYETLSKQGAP